MSEAAAVDAADGGVGSALGDADVA